MSREKSFRAGFVGVAGYLPAKPIAQEHRARLLRYLRTDTHLPPEYIDAIERDGALPGSVESNAEGWEEQPWFPTWLDRLPPKRRADPFGGTKQRLRVPLDPMSVRESVRPHPMLSSDAETLAGAMALVSSGVPRDAIDLVMVSSLVPDRHVPLNASLVQHKLRLDNAGAYNVDTCCSSFLTMTELAAALIEAGIKRNILLVASAIDSHINDRSNYYSPNTGDGAMAGVMGRVDPAYGYLASHSTSHGSRHAAIVFQKRHPELAVHTTQGPTFEQEFVTFHDQHLCKEIARHTLEDIREVVSVTLRKAGTKASDLSWLITHQPVAWAADAWREAIGLGPDQYVETFAQYGNMACASAPANLWTALEGRKVREGDLIMMVSPGVGENHIAVLQSASPQVVRQVVWC